MSAYKKIRAAMRQREREVLSAIRRAAKSGERWRPAVLCSLVWYNAIERLEQRGRIRYVRTRRRFYAGSGYEEV